MIKSTRTLPEISPTVNNEFRPSPRYSPGAERTEVGAPTDTTPVRLLDNCDLDRMNRISRIPVRLSFASHISSSYRKTNPAEGF